MLAGMPDVAPGVVTALPLVLVLVPVLALVPALFPAEAGALVSPEVPIALARLVLARLLDLATACGLPGPTAEICVWLGTMSLPAGPLTVCPRNGIIA